MPTGFKNALQVLTMHRHLTSIELGGRFIFRNLKFDIIFKYFHVEA